MALGLERNGKIIVHLLNVFLEPYDIYMESLSNQNQRCKPYILLALSTVIIGSVVSVGMKNSILVASISICESGSDSVNLTTVHLSENTEQL